MSYSKQTWANLDVITAGKLNHMEDGIAGVDQGKADSSVIAPAFSTGTSYAIGDYCIYSGTLYRFISAHSAGEWTGTDAEAVDVGGELGDLKSALDDVVDLNNTGRYYIDSSFFEAGGFTTNTGKQADSRRIRLKNAIYLNKGSKITFPNNNLYYNVWYLEDNDLATPSVISSILWNQLTEITMPYPCYVYVSVATGQSWATSTNIAVTDFTGNITVFAKTQSQLEIGELNEDIHCLRTDQKQLYLGEFVQSGYSATDFSASVYRICMKDCVALPYGSKTKIHVSMNPKYLFAVRCGRTAQNLSSNKYWYHDGDEVTFTNNEQYYRVIFAEAGSAEGMYEVITPDKLTDINPKITYSHVDGATFENVYDSNADNLERLLNAQNVLSSTSHGGIGTLPLIFHASDFHGDYIRVKNVLDLSQHYGADATVLSGDIVAYQPKDGARWMHSLFSSFSGKPIICIGNHEVTQTGITDEQVYEYFMEPSATKIGNINEKTYYYTDVSSKSLRIIVTDVYQYGATTRSNAHMSSEQLAYICSALKSAPNGYGILIVSHTPCVDVGSLASQDYSTFFQSLRKYGFAHYDITGTPIYDIVDAFIGRTTISETYSQTGSPNSISVSDDFSGVDSSVEFIAHLTGHIHEDSVCYLPTNHKQLMLNISCGNAMNGGSAYPYLADDCDITRVPYGKTQDAINAYVIDRTNKQVKIVRIGGTLTYDMKKREYMAIPYAD